MLSGALFDTYRRYKTDTERVILWLIAKSGYNGDANLPASRWPDLAGNVPANCDCSKIIQILDQVINARSECAAQYKHKIEQQTSNAKHDHFIRILKDVRRQLPRLQSATTRHERNDTESEHQGLKNRFELLELQEPVEWDDHVVRAASGSSQHAKEDDDVFASFCFLVDCHRIRKQVMSMWKQYRGKEVSLVAAALTTNVAFDNIKRLHSELSESFPTYATYGGLEKILLDGEKYPEACFASLHVVPEPLPGHEGFNVLAHYLKGYEGNVFRDFEPDDNEFDFTTSQAPRSNKITRLLARTIPDMLCFVLALGEGSPLDETSYMLKDFYQSHKPTVPLVIACEMFVDINLMLLQDARGPYFELKASAFRAETVFGQLDVHQKVLDADCSRSDTRTTIATTKAFIQFAIKQDTVAEYRATCIVPARATAPFYMLKHHPTLCGLLQFHIERTVSYIGLRLCDECECCIGALHLYNALKPQVTTWTDMETVISMYGETYLFKGIPPKRPREQFKRYKITMGTSSVQLQNGSRRVRKIAPVMLEVKQPLLDVMRQRYSVNHGKKDSAIVLQDIEHILRLKDNNIKSEAKTRAMRALKRHKRIDPAQMLVLVAEAVKLEETQLYFDFVSFNRRCLELLRRLRVRVIDRVVSIRWPKRLLDNQFLCGTSWFIMETLSRDDSRSEQYREITKQLMEEMISRGVATLLKRCSVDLDILRFK